MKTKSCMGIPGGVIRALVLLFPFFMALTGCNQEPKVFRVGILSGVEAMASIADGFRSEMAELGYVEGKNISYDLQKVDADPEGEKRIVDQFTQDDVDMIFAFPTDTALTAKKATQGTDIPVLFAHGEAVKIGLVESVSNPGGNVTGCRTDPAETTAKNFEILLELVPQAKRIYLVYNPDYVNADHTLELLRSASSAANVTFVEDKVADLNELRTALQKRSGAGAAGIDCILVMPDPVNYSPNGFSMILEFGQKHKIPIGGGTIPMADKGSLFSNFPDNVKTGRAVAALADKILKGANPESIPVITPNDYLKLNYRECQKLGLEVSSSLLRKADDIIR